MARVFTGWSRTTARRWHKQHAWIIGCNFTPAYAVNQLEMWQADSFDALAIDGELALAAGLGMNTVRVYLHDLLWAADAEGFAARIDIVLALAARHGIKVMPVLFDSCWNPAPALGIQPVPMPGVHNSGWVQSPGMAALADVGEHARLQAYVEGVVGRYADDPRILAWDIWNEPDNGPEVARCDPEELGAKAALVAPLLAEAFAWARSVKPTQPLTSAVWLGDWSCRKLLSAIQDVQLVSSDIISFHNYGDSEDFARRITWLKSFGRPLICTEFMARPVGSTFEAILPIARAHGVGALCWGLVRGKTQTHLPWDSWTTPYGDDHDGPWFHDVFHADGTPHNADEVALIRSLALAACSLTA